MTILAIWLVIWFILNIILIVLAIYLQILKSKKYLDFLQKYAEIKHKKLTQPKKKLKFNLKRRLKK